MGVDGVAAPQEDGAPDGHQRGGELERDRGRPEGAHDGEGERLALAGGEVLRAVRHDPDIRERGGRPA